MDLPRYFARGFLRCFAFDPLTGPEIRNRLFVHDSPPKAVSEH